MKIYASKYAVSLMAFGALTFALTGCLQTRQELRGGAPTSKAAQQSQVDMQRDQVQPLPPDPVAYDEQFKELRNRLDLLENSIAQSAANSTSTLEEKQRANQELNDRFMAYEQALKNLEIQILGLVKEVHDLKKKALSSSSSSSAPKGDFDKGEDLFNKKQWQDAILAYQAYRDKNSKGKNYSEATYKIGVCFQELGLKDEARAFYNEAIAKFPKTNAASKSKTRLKNLK